MRLLAFGCGVTAALIAAAAAQYLDGRVAANIMAVLVGFAVSFGILRVLEEK